MSDIKVLNCLNGAQPTAEVSLDSKASVELSRRIQKLIKRIKGEFLMCDFVNYEALKSSELYKEYLAAIAQLPSVDLSAYTENQRKAFFINIYNSLTIHGVLSLDTLPNSVLDVRHFWQNTAYRIGEHVFSLDDIEHGILRGNRPHPANTSPTYFSADDCRVKYAAKEVDPRIHCALNCGAKSCPVISSYSEDNLDSALDDAAKTFCNQEIIVLPKNEEVYVSKLFQWYERDFGEDDIAAVRWTLKYLDEEKRAQLGILLQCILTVGKGKIMYNEYDWSLNKSFT